MSRALKPRVQQFVWKNYIKILDKEGKIHKRWTKWADSVGIISRGKALSVVSIWKCDISEEAGPCPQLRTPGWDTSHTRQRAFCRSFCWWLVSVCGGCSNALITINSDRKSHRLMSGWQPSGSLFPTRKNDDEIPDPHSIASSSRLLDLVLRIRNIKAIIAAAQYRCFNVKIFGKNNKHKWGGRVELDTYQPARL